MSLDPIESRLHPAIEDQFRKFAARIAELVAERDQLQAKVAHLDKLADLYPISLGNACDDRDKLKHSDRALRKENAALRKALEELASTANSIYRNQQMSTQAVASALLDLIVRYATIPQPTPDSLEQSSPDGGRAGNT